MAAWSLRSRVNCIHSFPYPFPLQTLLDMVENYPTALRSLVLAENSISPELQQQICDLLSEGEEEEEVAGGPGDTQERQRAREPAAHQRGSSSWTGPSGKSPQRLIGGFRPGRQGVGNLGHLFVVPRGRMPGGLNTPPPSTDPSSQMVLMTSGLGDSLLAETEM